MNNDDFNDYENCDVRPWIAESQDAMIKSLFYRTKRKRCAAIGFVVRRNKRSVIIEMGDGRQFTINCHGCWLNRHECGQFTFTFEPEEKYGIRYLRQAEIAKELALGSDYECHEKRYFFKRVKSRKSKAQETTL